MFKQEGCRQYLHLAEHHIFCVQGHCIWLCLAVASGLIVCHFIAVCANSSAHMAAACVACLAPIPPYHHLRQPCLLLLLLYTIPVCPLLGRLVDYARSRAALFQRLCLLGIGLCTIMVFLSLFCLVLCWQVGLWLCMDVPSGP